MTSRALVRPTSATAWELRRAWANGLRVSLRIDGATGDERRVEGHVTTVSATGAYAVVSGVHIPLERVLAVHRPSRLGDSTYDGHDSWRGAVPSVLERRYPGQLTLDL